MEAKESLIDIARELNLNNTLEDATLSQSEILLAILKRKNSDIDWPEMKYGASNVIFDKFLKDGMPHSHVLGTVTCVAQYGGEGMGDDYWIVVHFPKFDTYIRVGWYASYDGGYLDGTPYIVEPKQRTITVYEKVKR